MAELVVFAEYFVDQFDDVFLFSGDDFIELADVAKYNADVALVFLYLELALAIDFVPDEFGQQNVQHLVDFLLLLNHLFFLQVNLDVLVGDLVLEENGDEGV